MAKMNFCQKGTRLSSVNNRNSFFLLLLLLLLLLLRDKFAHFTKISITRTFFKIEASISWTGTALLNTPAEIWVWDPGDFICFLTENSDLYLVLDISGQTNNGLPQVYSKKSSKICSWCSKSLLKVINFCSIVSTHATMYMCLPKQRPSTTNKKQGSDVLANQSCTLPSISTASYYRLPTASVPPLFNSTQPKI